MHALFRALAPVFALAACSDTQLKAVTAEPADAVRLLTVDPTELDFGLVPPGAPVARVVDLTATGTSPVTISSLFLSGAGAYSLTWPEGPVTLLPGEQREVVVSYTPQSGLDIGRIGVNSDAESPYQEVALTGGGYLPAMAVDPPVVYLASPFPGEVSAVVTLTSVGAADLVVASMLVQGEPFAAVGSFPVTLPPGTSAEVTVTYTPTADGESVSGELWFTDNTTVGYAMVPLVGSVPTEEEPVPATEAIYLNSGADLYSYDPDTNLATRIGSFETGGGAVTGMTDIAIALDGRLYGCDWDTLYVIDPTDAATTALFGLGGSPKGMTFLSDGRLVVAGGGIDVYDLATGTAENLFASGVYATSGDILGLPDSFLYWTTTGGDQLIRLDPATGDADNLGSLGTGSVWGLAYADEVTFGFTGGGAALRIDPTSATVTDTASLSGSWWGATTNPVRW